MLRKAALLAVLAALAAPATAHAAVPLAPCGKTAGLRCGTVDVPVDRSGAVPGALALHVEVLPPTSLPRGTIFLVAGGPGQGSARVYNLGEPQSAAFLRFLLPGYTLVAFDNRGTGDSALISCPTLQSALFDTADEDARLAADCAATIGPTRQFYATRDHAEDIDSVRAALGLGRIGLFGVSYGTKLALAYALAHPAQVSLLLLDSVVPPTLPDPFESNVLRELPGALATFCAGARCRAATPNFAADVVALANRLEARPLQGKVLVAPGRAKTVRMNGEDLIGTLLGADLSPGLAAELPAAVHAARLGYGRPLLRLFDLSERTSLEPARDLSFGLYAATTCADGLFPWTPETPVADRPALVQQAIARLPAGALGPFGSWAARLGSATFCQRWPTPTGSTPLGPGPLPDVPMLAVSGGFDLRTPTVNAQAVVRLFPHGQLLVVPGVGHSVLTADFSLCSQRVVRTWLTGGAIPSACPRVAPLTTPVAAFPRPPARATPTATIVLAAKAVRDAEATWLQAVFSAVQVRPAGLYGGTLVPTARGFRLVRYSVLPGVRVSGTVRVSAATVPFSFRGTLRVSGSRAAAGTVRVATHSASGRLGGRRVATRF